MHITLFARYRTGFEPFKSLQTFIIDEIKVSASKAKSLATMVDDTSVYGFPGAEVQTFRLMLLDPRMNPPQAIHRTTFPGFSSRLERAAWLSPSAFLQAFSRCR